MLNTGIGSPSALPSLDANQSLCLFNIFPITLPEWGNDVEDFSVTRPYLQPWSRSADKDSESEAGDKSKARKVMWVTGTKWRKELMIRLLEWRF